MPNEVGIDGIQRLIHAGAQLIEILPAREYSEEHLPGAINIPLKSLTEDSVSDLDRAQPTVVYCWDYQ